MPQSLLRLGILSLIAALLSGCNMLPSHSANSGTAAAVGQVVGSVNTSVKGLEASQDAFLKALDTRDQQRAASGQFIADRLAEAQYMNLNNPTQNAVTPVISSNLNAAATAVGIPPSAAVKDQEINDLKLALSASANDAKLLAVRNQQLADQANQLQGQTVALDKQVKDGQAAMVAATKDVDAKTNALNQAKDQVDINAAEAKVAQQQRDQEAAEKARIETARWFMVAGGILIALSVVGLFLHIEDAWIAAAAGVTLIVTGWGITYVEGLLQEAWFRWTLDGVVVFGLGSVVWFIYRTLDHKKSTTTTAAGFQALVGSIEEVAAKNPTVAAELQPLLQQWLVTDKGVPDQTVITAINNMAISLNLINPGQTAAATGTKPTVAATPAPAAAPASPTAQVGAPVQVTPTPSITKTS